MRKSSKGNSKLIVLIAIAVVAIIGMAGLYQINGDSFNLNGRQVVLITTDSMDGDVTEYTIDSFPAETLVMIKHVPDHQKRFIRVGDVISYNYEGTLNHHRVVGIGDGYVMVRGDNGHSTDEVTYDEINGVIVGTDPVAGHVIVFVAENLLALIASAFIITVLLVSLAYFRGDRGTGSKTRAVAVTAVMVIVFASALAGIGYAYEVTTVNESNNVSSEYVVLTQQNYNFSKTDLDFDVKNTEAGTVYRLNGTAVPLMSIDGIAYYGIQIGDADKLTANATGSLAGQVLKVAVTSPTGFTDYSDQLMGWKYVLEITATDKPTQYAFYDGADDGLWNVKGTVIGTSYTVSADDANKGNYITLYKTDGGGRFTVVKIDGSTTSVESNLLNGAEIKNVDGWYVDGRQISGNYVVNADDADGGRVIILYKTAASNYTVIKVGDGTVNMESGKTPGQSVSGVTGWMYGGGTKLNIQAGVDYTTKLFFAGSGVFSDASLKSIKTVVKTTTQLTVVPVWIPVDDSDTAEMVRYTLKAGVGGIGNDRIAYVRSGDDLVLPENVFTNSDPNKKFIGWTASNTDKVFTPWHVYNSNTQERTFTAQWADVNNCFTVSLYDGDVEQSRRYILKNTDSGSTFTLPYPEFTKSGCSFAGWVVTGTTGNYAAYTKQFTDIPAVKEDIRITAKWTEEPAICGRISIADQENTVIKVDSDGSASMIRNLNKEDVVTGVDGWLVNGRTISGSYIVDTGDAEIGGYIVLYHTANASGVYDVIKVEGGNVTVVTDKSVDDKIDKVGGWMVGTSSVYGGVYYVRGADADSSTSKFIVVYNDTNADGRYTVIKVYKDGSITMTRDLVVNDKVSGVSGWHRQNTTFEIDTYTVSGDDATNGFIVLYEDGYDTSKYTVLKVDKRNVSSVRDLAENAAVPDVSGWKVKGEAIGTYTVNASDAGSGGYIVLYNNSSFRYLVHTDAEAKYVLPYSVFSPPESLWKDGFNGWKFMGWSVSSTFGKLVPQAMTMPYGTDGDIVKNGIIRFTYINDLDNGGN